MELPKGLISQKDRKRFAYKIFVTISKKILNFIKR